MLQSYIKIAFRNLTRDKAFALTNLLGLSVGTACCLLIFLWVAHECHMDNFHVNGQQLFTVYERYRHDGQVGAGYNTRWLLANEMKKVIPDIELASGLAFNRQETFQVNDKILQMQGSCAGTDFFRMFDYPLLEGTASTALNEPASIAISRRMAEIFFGSPSQAMGKTIRFENRKVLVVTAVFENLPALASEKFEYLLNWDAWLADNPDLNSWETNGPRTYVQLRPDADPSAVERKISHFLDGYDRSQTSRFRVELGLQPFGAQYLYSSFTHGRPDSGRIVYVQLFSWVAICILLLACINFMNLATARSVKRAREVGIRKVVGALRRGIMVQFFGEAILLALLAVLFAVWLVWLLLPTFNVLTGKELAFPFSQPIYYLGLGGLVLMIGAVAGSYPALFLSSLQPIRVLKGIPQFGVYSLWLRKGLVIFQFTLSIILIIGTLVVSRQTTYLQQQDIGYVRKTLLYFPLEGALSAHYSLFKQQASKVPGIEWVDVVSQTPQQMEFRTFDLAWEGKDPSSAILFTTTSVGYDYVKLMGLQLLQGRDFSNTLATDSASFLINETAARTMGYLAPIGKPITLFGRKGHIIGLVKDFHYNSLQKSVRPLIIDLQTNHFYGNVLVRTQPGKTKEALASLEVLYHQLNPGHAFSYSFFEEEYQRFYQNEQIITKLSTTFAFVAVFISCLGLLGLSMFTAHQRTREIGIRKVLGASVTNIVFLLSKEFLCLVAIAYVIATPIAWFTLKKWLEQYAYRVEMTGGILALAGILALLIALLTVSSQALKASLANPVKALRSE
jgi:ABC-type antimicrobial peptide transport system permease subunit